MPRPPVERALHARLAAYSKWAQTDAREGTAAARAAFLSKFETAVDPDGVLDPAERARRADAARKAHFTKMALNRQASRRKAGNTGTAA